MILSFQKNKKTEHPIERLLYMKGENLRNNGNDFKVLSF